MRNEIKIKRCTFFNVGSTAYYQHKIESNTINNIINVAVFSENLIVAWSHTKYNSFAIASEINNPDSYINIRVCIVDSHGSKKEKHICCMAMSEYSIDRFNQWDDGAHPVGFDVFFNKDYAINELGLSEKILSSQLAQLEHGKIVNDCSVYIDVIKNADFVRDVFFSTEYLDVIKKINIAAIASNLIARILGAAMEDKASRQPKKDLLKISRAKDFIERNLSKIINVEEIAKEIGVSQSKLMKTFRHIEDRTIGDYIIERKMYHAAILISKRMCSISEAAYEVGYEHPSNFSTAFKKYHGVTPRQFQNMRQNLVSEI